VAVRRLSSESAPNVVRSAEEIEAYVAKICFKTGPPELIGVELEWTVHHDGDPAHPLDLDALRAALDSHAPPTLHPNGPHRTLPAGGTVSVEPGGQVEISTPAFASLAQLHSAASHDLRHLTGLLARAGLVLGPTGIDAFRPPRRLLQTPRYDAMADAFAREGPEGLRMMCSTAALQVCLDAGRPARLAARWRALHELGPVLLAAFSNSPHRLGLNMGLASARMATWFGIDPARAAPVPTDEDPATAWTRYALRAPVVCLRAPGNSWHAPPGVTFADWLAGAISRPPTVADLELHLSTLFPPVRPRGYFEVRYLDAQHPDEWIAPVAVLAALLADDATVDRARELCAPAAGRWLVAARRGLGDPTIGAAAQGVLDLARRRLDRTDLTSAVRQDVSDVVDRRLAGIPEGDQ
jgi:glutamate--cysteine ligase